MDTLGLCETTPPYKSRGSCVHIRSSKRACRNLLYKFCKLAQVEIKAL